MHLSVLQAQYSPMKAEADGEAPPTLAAFSARAAQDKQITVRDVWGLMLHSVKGAAQAWSVSLDPEPQAPGNSSSIFPTSIPALQAETASAAPSLPGLGF